MNYVETYHHNRRVLGLEPDVLLLRLAKLRDEMLYHQRSVAELTHRLAELKAEIAGNKL